MKVLAIQLDPAWDNPTANLAKVSEIVRSAAPAHETLVVLPEMFASGFNMDVSAAVRRDREIVTSLQNLATELGVGFVAGVARASAGGKGTNNATVVGTAGNLVTEYAKIHPFTLGGESDAYDAGQQIVTFPWGQFTVCPFVCYDLRFPEIFRHATINGANLFIVIANWPISRVEHWVTLLRARAIENQAWVVGCNRTGRDPNTLYSGRSIVVDPLGVIRADAGDSEGVLRCEIDLQLLTETRSKLRFLGDIRKRFLGVAE